MDVEKIGAAASTVTDQASDLADTAAGRMADAAKSARDIAGDAATTAYNSGAQATRYAGETVRQQPLLSVLGVAAIGYAIGFLIHSSASPFASKPPKTRFLGR